MRAHNILATFLFVLIGIRRSFGGGASIHTSWFRGSAYANASWQPVNGLFPFRVAARQALRKKSRTVCCIGLLFLIIRRCRQLLLLLVFSIQAVFCDGCIVRLFRKSCLLFHCRLFQAVFCDGSIVRLFQAVFCDGSILRLFRKSCLLFHCRLF